MQRHCCLVAFVRGLFLGCGSMSAPGAPVHVEFTVEDEGFADQVCRLLGRLGLQFSATSRDRNVACYSKRSETGADLLAVLGAHDACLRWEEHMVLGQVRERANRLANCDEANARRAASAGERQADAARRLMASRELAVAARLVALRRRASPGVPVPEPAGAGGARPAAAQQVGAQPSPAAADRARRRPRRLTAYGAKPRAGATMWPRPAASPVVYMLRAMCVVSSPSRYV